jgi:hypothetical protein
MDLKVKQIKKAAAADVKKRRDIRYKRAMAFLVRKGFLKTNIDFDEYYTARVHLKDFIWAGKNVEPRILEVLPAAAARLPKAVVIDQHPDADALQQVLRDLHDNREDAADFLNMPYKKIKVWMNLALNDKRTKLTDKKKLTKTFRLKPEAIYKLEQLKIKFNLSEAGLIEKLLAQAYT